MSLNDRLDYEEGKITSDELIMMTCVRCRYWYSFVKKKYNYCHKCINNPKIRIRKFSGINLSELFDYYEPHEEVKVK